MRTAVRIAAGAMLAWSAIGVAQAACSIGKLMDLPVTMEGHVPLVSATVNGNAVNFEADSGAFFSMMSASVAAQFQLKHVAAPPGFYVSGVGGRAADASVVSVKNFDLGKFHVHDIQFVTLDNDFGHAGLLGQNIFGKFDVEYDLAQGMIRLFQSKGCEQTSMAYWTKGNDFSIVKIQQVTEAAFHTVGNLTLNGASVAAMFDTGAGTSILSLAAAARAGVRPNSPGVEEAGYSYGIGRRQVKTWIGRFASIKIGDNEEIKNIRIRFGDIGDVGESSMLLGADFFLSHRVMVDNRTHRLFLTYNGGPVFNLSHDTNQDGAPVAPGAALAGADPTDAGGFSRRGAAYLSRRDVPRALADLRQAVKLAPGEALYHRQLATALLAGDRHDEAMGELDAAIAARHDDPDALLMRAELRMAHDKAGARADADALDKAAPLQANDRLALGGLYEQLHAPGEAIRSFSQWIAAHPNDIELANALNDRCWVRALANTELDGALDDCNRAVRLSAKASSIVDSRALVWFRKGDFAHARADYDLAIKGRPDAASSLFMRGVTETRLGDAKAAEADFKAAKAIDEQAGAQVAAWGITP